VLREPKVGSCDCEINSSEVDLIFQGINAQNIN